MPKGVYQHKKRGHYKPPEMLATEIFRIRLTLEQKQQLDFVARQQGRSKANLIKWLVTKEYERVKGNNNGNSKK